MYSYHAIPVKQYTLGASGHYFSGMTWYSYINLYLNTCFWNTAIQVLNLRDQETLLHHQKKLASARQCKFSLYCPLHFVTCRYVHETLLDMSYDMSLDTTLEKS
jgi:hypothetical protein